MEAGLTIRMLLAVGMLAGLAWLAHALKRKRLRGVARGVGLSVRDRVALSNQHTLHWVALPDGGWVVVATSPAGCQRIAQRGPAPPRRAGRKALRLRSRGASAG